VVSRNRQVLIFTPVSARTTIPVIHPTRSRTNSKMGTKPSWIIRALFGCFCLGLSMQVPKVIGQETPPPSEETTTSPPKIPEVLVPGSSPDAILDSQGEQIFVPKDRYRDFEKFLREQSNVSNLLASGDVLEQMELAIRIDKNVARCRVEADATLASANKRWLNVPIGLIQLQAIPSTSTVDGTAVFPPLKISNNASGFANNSNGYVWRISPSSELHRKLKFQALTNVTTTNQGDSICLWFRRPFDWNYPLANGN
jgi:hypothetical protein